MPEPTEDPLATVTGNVVDFQGSPRPNLSPQLVFAARGPASQGANMFFTNRIIIPTDIAGAFSVPLIDSFSTTPNALYDVSIEWLDSSGGVADIDELTTAATPLVVPVAGGALGDMLQLPTSATEVWVSETNNLAYGFWYQPSTALLRSNP